MDRLYVILAILYASGILINIVYWIIELIVMKKKGEKVYFKYIPFIILLALIFPIIGAIVSGIVYDDMVDTKNYWRDKYRKLLEKGVEDKC